MQVSALPNIQAYKCVAGFAAWPDASEHWCYCVVSLQHCVLMPCAHTQTEKQSFRSLRLVQSNTAVMLALMQSNTAVMLALMQ